MSKYDGCYIKLADDPTYYAVDNGQKTIVQDADQMHKIGLRPIHVVTQTSLNRIPFVGEDEEE